jgi:chemotaxis methyl-accepting protein methylase
MDKFKHVVGVIHTNYLSYTRSYTLGQIKEPLVYYVNQGGYLVVGTSEVGGCLQQLSSNRYV